MSSDFVLGMVVGTVINTIISVAVIIYSKLEQYSKQKLGGK